MLRQYGSQRILSTGFLPLSARKQQYLRQFCASATHSLMLFFWDLLSLLLVSHLSNLYWRAWVAPQVFFLRAGNTDLAAPGGREWLVQVPPQSSWGWSSCKVMLTHCKAGGGTSGRWLIVVWYPPERAVPSPAPLDPLPWFPICSSVLNWLAPMPVRVPLLPAKTRPRWRMWCGSQWRSFEWGGGQRPVWCIHGVFSWPQTSPRRSCSPWWAVSWDLAFDRVRGPSLRLFGMYRS